MLCNRNYRFCYSCFYKLNFRIKIIFYKEILVWIGVYMLVQLPRRERVDATHCPFWVVTNLVSEL